MTHETDTTYREIRSRYDSEFPRRSVALTVVANSKGTTKDDRLEDIATWVNN